MDDTTGTLSLIGFQVEPLNEKGFHNCNQTAFLFGGSLEPLSIAKLDSKQHLLLKDLVHSCPMV
jgi:hypothetical protein